MHLKTLHLQAFRNVAFTRIALEAPAVFFLGNNGQGKTNLLEAVGMMSALRSFRTAESKALIAHEHSEALIRYELEHEHEEACDLTLSLCSSGKTVSMDGEKLPRLADIIGRFPTVALCADDIQLLRGSPGLRRRFVDMTLSIDPNYFHALTRYHRALRQRNACLREDKTAPATLAAFEREMAPAAVTLVTLRQAYIEQLHESLESTYTGIANGREQPGIHYKANKPLTEAEAFTELWESNRARDLASRTTRSGPHRDDIQLMLDGAPAREFASEGQQRALVLALKLAQAQFTYIRRATRPIILADDILGQLDPERQERFWHTLGNHHQVLATGTVLPSATPASQWRVYSVDAGNFSEKAP